MNVNRSLIISLGALVILVVVAGLAFASDASPTEEPAASPYFDATLQQAVDELNGKARLAAASGINQPQPTSHYTTDPELWPECQFGYTQNPISGPGATIPATRTSPSVTRPGPPRTTPGTRSSGPSAIRRAAAISQDPTGFWCDPAWTHDPTYGPQCGLPNLHPRCRDVALVQSALYLGSGPVAEQLLPRATLLHRPARYLA